METKKPRWLTFFAMDGRLGIHLGGAEFIEGYARFCERNMKKRLGNRFI
jgi:hypothetical protein